MQELQPKQHWFKVIDTDENPDLTELVRTHSLRNHKLGDRYNSTDYQTVRTQAEGPHAWSRAARARDDMHIQGVLVTLWVPEDGEQLLPEWPPI